MTTETKDPANPEKETSLLSSEERAILSEITAQEPPFSQRAQALLALDEGATQSAAGHQSGLSIGQVRYWLGKFRKSRLSVFPEELLDLVQQEDVEPLSSPDTPDIEQVSGEEEVQQEMPDAKETAEPVDDAAALQEDPPEERKKSKKKSGESKKSKKTKKLKQDKKAKKEKKSKKKNNKPKKGKKGKKSKKAKKKRKKQK